MQTCHGDLGAAAADAASAGYASEATFLQQLVWATGSQGSQAKAACSQQGSQVTRPARSCWCTCGTCGPRMAALIHLARIQIRGCCQLGCSAEGSGGCMITIGLGAGALSQQAC